MKIVDSRTSLLRECIVTAISPGDDISIWAMHQAGFGRGGRAGSFAQPDVAVMQHDVHEALMIVVSVSVPCSQ